VSGPSPAAGRSAHDAALTAERDAAITAAREETKYLVDASALHVLTRHISAELEPHRFTGEAANLLPGAQHFVTTIYFDTPSLSYLGAAKANQQSHLKVRAKEYYDIHPSLAELATDPEQIQRYQPWLWFELKRREGLSTSKRRFRFPKAAAATLFDDNRAPGNLPEGGEERADADALIAHVNAQAERIVPSAIVNYRRLSYQNPDSTLRVTIDLGLAFFPVPPDLFRRARPLSKAELGKPAGVEPRAVVEVKRRAFMPIWLEQALAAASSSAISYSKFVAASEAVHGG
jgi:hypothetical protein